MPVCQVRVVEMTGLLDLGWVVGKINVKKGGMFTLKNFPEPCLLTNWFDALCSQYNSGK